MHGSIGYSSSTLVDLPVTLEAASYIIIQAAGKAPIREGKPRPLLLEVFAAREGTPATVCIHTQCAVYARHLHLASCRCSVGFGSRLCTSLSLYSLRARYVKIAKRSAPQAGTLLRRIHQACALCPLWTWAVRTGWTARV
jgi:hypothetical protein